jgi:hypothetical protein
MKEDNIQHFFNQHKETIPGEGFNARLFNTLDVLPQPRTRKNQAPLIVGISAGIGFLLFVLIGGYGVLMNGLSSIGQVFVDVRTLSPDVLTACIMLALLFIALFRLAARTYHQ